MKKEVFVAVVYASRYGHTKILAEAVARGAEAAGARVELIDTVAAAAKMAELDKADAIVFGTPTFMGNISSEMKIFMEKCVGRWVSRAWSDKIAGGFSCSSNFSGDKLNTMMGLTVFAMQLGMIWVGDNQLPGSNVPDESNTVEGPGSKAWNRNCAGIGPMASVFNVKAPDAPASGDVETAEAYGKRIADVTAKFNL